LASPENVQVAWPVDAATEPICVPAVHAAVLVLL
jgi:hypothetical protein